MSETIKLPVKVTMFRENGMFYTTDDIMIDIDKELMKQDLNVLGERYATAHRKVREALQPKVNKLHLIVLVEDVDPDGPCGSTSDILCYPELILPQTDA
jgi:hypothetical protein